MAYSWDPKQFSVADGGTRTSSLFVPGKNCWRVSDTDRVGLLVDGDAYFKAFAAAALRARHSIFLLAWDFHSNTPLRCEGEPGEGPAVLGDFLNFIARRRRGLEIRVLIWDYPMVFGADREFPPAYGLGWKAHRRVQVRYDNTHPFTGSHHQKVLVVDDRLAFCGGLDLTAKRWDTCQHLAGDPRRMHDGVTYPPFHDVMIMVDGDAARSLGLLCRDRWQRATGKQVPLVTVANDPWPPHLEPAFRDVEVAISRTVPSSEQRSAVREVEALYVDMISAARDTIFIENQYFTSQAIGAALEARLVEPQGPEIVVVLRLLSHGWLEEVTMHNLRARLIKRLREVDVHGRLHVYYPFIEGLAEDTCIDIHSKVLIVDDDWLRVGSSNVSNRSMGFDTECDLTLEAHGRPEVSRGIAKFRSELLGEHLGVPPERVAREIKAAGSVHGAIDRLHSEHRMLKRLQPETERSDTVLTLASIADPEQPVTLDNLIKQFSPRTEVRAGLSRWAKLVGVILLVAGLTAIWRFTPLADYITAERVTGWAREFASAPWAPLIVLSAYTPASLVMFPRPVITLFAVVAFGPWLGFTYAMSGILIAAFLSYAAGMRLDRSAVRRMSGPKLDRMIQVLRERGLIAVTALRLVPLAPFIAEGLVAGAIRIKLWHFMLGTFIGMLPGTLAATVFGDQLEAALTGKGKINVWLIAAMLGVLVAGAALVRRWLLTAPLQNASAGKALPDRQSSRKTS
jgi:phospholipase D1/2